MVIDLIFRGLQSKVNLTFLVELMKNKKEARFDSPEDVSIVDYVNVRNIIDSNDYVNFVITTDNMVIGKQTVKNVFVNLSLLNREFELLFFFDLKDLDADDDKSRMDYLRNWANKFRSDFSFENFVCQMDNGNESEYYFDSTGLGPLYNSLN